MQTIAIVGNHTDAGKTLASAIVCEALEADYWKPIQSGTNISADTITVKQLLSNEFSVCHPETYSLTEPVSPHLAAQKDGITIELDKIVLPITQRPLVMETAGGLLSPLNDTLTMLDLVKQFECKVVLVSRHYLGSINHTLLTAAVLKQHNIPVVGILFNGENNPSSESFILAQTGLPKIGRIPELSEVTAASIQKIAAQLKPQLSLFLS
jgi:dethiobiotin synthetase